MSDGLALAQVSESAPMTKAEARTCIEQAKASLGAARQAINRLYEGRGWEALGYASFGDCLKAEFGYSVTHGYRLIKASAVDANLGVEVPERHARMLAALSPDDQRAAYDKACAIAETEGERLTDNHIKTAIEVIKASATVSQSDYRVVARMVETGEVGPVDGAAMVKALEALNPTRQAAVLELMSAHGLTCPELIQPIGQMFERRPGQESLVLPEIQATGHLAGVPLAEATLSDLKRANEEARLQHVSDAQAEIKAKIITVYPDDAPRTLRELKRALGMAGVVALMDAMASESSVR